MNSNSHYYTNSGHFSEEQITEVDASFRETLRKAISAKGTTQRKSPTDDVLYRAIIQPLGEEGWISLRYTPFNKLVHSPHINGIFFWVEAFFPERILFSRIGQLWNLGSFRPVGQHFENLHEIVKAWHARTYDTSSHAIWETVIPILMNAWQYMPIFPLLVLRNDQVVHERLRHLHEQMLSHLLAISKNYHTGIMKNCIDFSTYRKIWKEIIHNFICSLLTHTTEYPLSSLRRTISALCVGVSSPVEFDTEKELQKLPLGILITPSAKLRSS